MSTSRTPVTLELRLLPWGQSVDQYVYRAFLVSPEFGEQQVWKDLTPPSHVPSLGDALYTLAAALVGGLNK